MERTKKIAVEASRILVGAVFVFSGFVKAVDPLGSAYKYHDYFSAWGLDFFEVLTLPMSFALSTLEFLLGACILLAIYRRFSTIMVMLFMAVMTPFTLYLAIANPVSDCGCFGDAWVISNWETFSKNAVLLVASVILFLWYKKMRPFFSDKMNGLLVFYISLFALSLSVYCYRNLPVLDFRPYKTGASISEGMVIPEGMPADRDITTFIYAKDGVQKEFSLEEAPMNDSTWVFVDAKNTVIKGYQPPIHDFTIVTPQGVDITEDVLQDTAYTFLLISPKLEKAEESNVDRINEIYDYAQEHGYRFYCMTASTAEDIARWKDNTGADYLVCTTDETTLKTIIRSNPGLMLVKEGVIYNKWHSNDIPENKELEEPLSLSPLGQIAYDSPVRKALALAILFLIPLVLLYSADHKARILQREREKEKEKEKTK